MASVSKVGSSSSVSSTGSAGRTGGVSSAQAAEFSSLLSNVSETSAPASVAGMTGVLSVDAILAAQFVDEADLSKQRKKRAVQHGNDILDKLEDLRLAILTGHISKQKLLELSNLLKQTREEGLDPELKDILDEIQLRADVELAKLTL